MSWNCYNGDNISPLFQVSLAPLSNTTFGTVWWTRRIGKRSQLNTRKSRKLQLNTCNRGRSTNSWCWPRTALAMESSANRFVISPDDIVSPMNFLPHQSQLNLSSHSLLCSWWQIRSPSTAVPNRFICSNRSSVESEHFQDSRRILQCQLVGAGVWHWCPAVIHCPILLEADASSVRGWRDEEYFVRYFALGRGWVIRCSSAGSVHNGLSCRQRFVGLLRATVSQDEGSGDRTHNLCAPFHRLPVDLFRVEEAVDWSGEGECCGRTQEWWKVLGTLKDCGKIYWIRRNKLW